MRASAEQRTTELIITGDDFGLALPVNEAIETGFRQGVLRSASLMVGANAAQDAVERARRMSGLAVGLHLVLVEGRPVLPPDRIPDLVTSDGLFLDDLFAAGVRFFFRPHARAQLRDEIRAQFEAFAETGLELDHVNAHNHMHLHPTVHRIVLEVGARHGLRAVRLPYEPVRWAQARVGLATRVTRVATGIALAPWIALLRSRLRRAGIGFNDQVLGLHQSGEMDESAVLELLRQLRPGVTEMYFHIATRRCPEIDLTTAAYRHEDELAALLSDRVRGELDRHGIRPTCFAELFAPTRHGDAA